MNDIGRKAQIPMAAMNVAITKISMCPTIMLAARRIERLMGLVI